MGSRLIAEYRVQEGKYYYYTSDQINSTRIVTNDSGAVVYAAAHDPFGGIQKTWTSTYDPALKFSGKERDAESGLDYFGARYYDKAQYRFISVDPVMTKRGAINNPQLWNLYSYCRNNPITFLDPDGKDSKKRVITITRYCYGPEGVYGRYNVDNVLFGYTLELPWKANKKDISCIRTGTYKAWKHYWEKKGVWVVRLEDKYGRTVIYLHAGVTILNTDGCPLLGKWLVGAGTLAEGKKARQEIIDHYQNENDDSETENDDSESNDLMEVIVENAEVTYTWHYGPATIWELAFPYGFPFMSFFII
jgi:RHS repeat-associated protein